MFKLSRENDLVTNIFQSNVNYAKYELQKMYTHKTWPQGKFKLIKTKKTFKIEPWIYNIISQPNLLQWKLYAFPRYIKLSWQMQQTGLQFFSPGKPIISY